MNKHENRAKYGLSTNNSKKKIIDYFIVDKLYFGDTINKQFDEDLKDEMWKKVEYTFSTVEEAFQTDI